MPDAIDYVFISELEGGLQTSGYVPAVGISRSGVTIATGFDLGQRSAADLRMLGLSALLMRKLQPYLGLKGEAAAALLRKQSLRITIAEARMIDKAVKAEHTLRLSRAYFASPLNKSRMRFEELPPAAQTVIASVSYQYGVNLASRTPVFWQAAAAQDWSKAVEILERFGDRYPSRRRKEARLLETLLEPSVARTAE